MKKTTLFYGPYIIGILSLVPVLVWLTLRPLQMRYISIDSIFTSLGQISSLVGTMLFSFSLILSARLKIYEKFFGGMNIVYKAHHISGGISFILLMLHPLLLTFTYFKFSPQSAFDFLFPANLDWGLNFGFYALFLLMFLLVLTYYADLPYEIWRYTHQFLGLALFLGALHVYLIPSESGKNEFITWYILSFAALGMVAYIYRTVLGSIFVPTSPYEVAAVNKIGNSVEELILKPLKAPLIFSPGQFVFAHFSRGFVSRETHPFSISSSPTEQNIRLTIKALGDYTSALSMLNPGAILQIEGPYGMFHPLGNINNKQIWFAGGIGITPFLSIARTNGAINAPTTLFYIARKQEELIHLDELQEIAVNLPQFNLVPYITSINGHITADYIKSMVPDVTERSAFLCGPPPMMISTRKILRKLGIKNSDIHSEEFSMH